MRLDPVALAAKLVAIETIAPPGTETACAEAVAELLEPGGFTAEWHEFAPGRRSLVARLAGADPALAPLAFTGHVDTVPLGTRAWTRNPLGEIADGRLYGRGSSDMKAGIAAFVCAALDTVAAGRPARGIEIVVTAGEETGCRGALDLAQRGALGEVSGLIIAEPTSNRLAIAHKGALHLRLRAAGRTAHGSMPSAGVNAITQAFDAIGRVAGAVPAARHALLGETTATVTTIAGGVAVNVVPDRCEFTLDIRTVPGQSHGEILKALHQACGPEVEIDPPLVDLPAVWTAPEHELVGALQRCLARVTAEPAAKPIGMPYFTDGSALQPGYGGCAAIILGPGEASQAHQTDEWCGLAEIERARDIYAALVREWCAEAPKEQG